VTDRLAAGFWERHGGRPLTFVFTDIVGSTRLKAMLGEDAGVARIQEHHAEVRRLLTDFTDAEEVRTSGDSFLIVFAEPADAVAFALTLQSALRARADEEWAMRDRIGIHQGAAVVQEGRGFKELLGSAVDACARLMSLADGDQILLTQATLESAKGRFAERWPAWGPRVQWLLHGRYYLKGIAGAQHIGEVGEPRRSRLQAPGGVWRSVRGRRSCGALLAVLGLGAVLIGPHLGNRRESAGPLRTRVVAVIPDGSAGDTNTLKLLEGVLLSTTDLLVGARSATAERVRVVHFADLVEQRAASAMEARRQFGATQVILAALVTNAGRWEIRLSEDRLQDGERTAPSVVIAQVGELGDLSGRVAARVAAMAALEVGPEDEALATRRVKPDDEAMGLYLTALGLLAERMSPVEGAKDAVALLSRSVTRDPMLGEAFAALGEAHWREFLRTSASTQLEAGFRAVLTAIELSNGKLASAHYSLGHLRHEVGDAPEAARAFRRTLELQPNHPDATRSLARVYASMGERIKAEQTYLDGVAVDPDNWRVHNSLGGFYYQRQESWPEAAAAFRRSAELAPSNYLVWANLGGVLVVMTLEADGAEGVRLEGECRGALDRSINLHPTSGAWSNRGTLEFFTGGFAASAMCFEEALRLSPDDPMIWGNLGDAARHLESGGQRAREAYRRAIELNEKLLAVNPRKMDIVATLAGLYAQQGDLVHSRAFADSAADLASLDIESQMYLALAWELLGERDRALTVIREAVAGGKSPRLFLRHPDLEVLVRAVMKGDLGPPGLKEP